jgi:hypothetical protein
MTREQFEAMSNSQLDAQIIKLERNSIIVSSADFVSGFVPPDYLIDGLVQRRFCYSLTAPTGSGKTAIALLLSASTALGRPIGEYAAVASSISREKIPTTFGCDGSRWPTA